MKINDLVNVNIIETSSVKDMKNTTKKRQCALLTVRSTVNNAHIVSVSKSLLQHNLKEIKLQPNSFTGRGTFWECVFRNCHSKR